MPSMRKDAPSSSVSAVPTRSGALRTSSPMKRVKPVLMYARRRAARLTRRTLCKPSSTPATISSAPTICVDVGPERSGAVAANPARTRAAVPSPSFSRLTVCGEESTMPISYDSGAPSATAWGAEDTASLSPHGEIRLAEKCPQLATAGDDLVPLAGEPRVDPGGPLVKGQRRAPGSTDRAPHDETAGVDEAHILVPPAIGHEAGIDWAEWSDRREAFRDGAQAK